MRSYSPNRAGSRQAGRLVAVSALLVLGTGSAVAAPSPSSLEEIREVLHRLPNEARTRADVVEGLTRLGPAAIPELYDLYTGTSFEDLLGAEEEFDLEDWWVAPDHFSALALEALGDMPPKSVVQHLRSRTRDADLEERMTVVRVLTELGSVHGLPLLLEQAQAASGLELRYGSVRGPLKKGLVRIAASDLVAAKTLEELVPQLDDELVLLVADAVVEAGRPEAAGFLLGLLGRTPEVDLVVLDGIGRIGALYPWKLQVDPRRAVRSYLEDADARLRQEAAIALGRLHDIDSFARIARLLVEKDPGVRKGARWALVEMSGRSDMETVEAWTSWYEAETTWWREEGTALRRRLDEDDPSALVKAIRGLSQHPLFRDAVAEDLVGLLPKVPTEMVPTVCKGLETIGSAQAVPALVDLLFDRDDRIRISAGSTLCALTGKQLPPEPRLWTRYVNG